MRGEVELIEVPHRIIKPRRFDITVQLNGVTWRRVQIEVSPDEGQAGARPEEIAAPSLAGFGLPTPDRIASLSMAYQIAQKVHACTDPHDPPAAVNDRARDVVDLLLLRDLIDATGEPTPGEVRAAIEDVFAARADEAVSTGATPRTWPTTVTAHAHWGASYTRAAGCSGGVTGGATTRGGSPASLARHQSRPRARCSSPRPHRSAPRGCLRCSPRERRCGLDRASPAGRCCCRAPRTIPAAPPDADGGVLGALRYYRRPCTPESRRVDDRE